MHDNDNSSRSRQLKTVIDEALSRYRSQLDSHGRIDQPPQNLTMYLGSRQGTYPKLLMQHPLLQPVDKVTWLTLKDQLEEAGAHLACLDATTTVHKVGVDSKKTVARALLILRALRLVIYYKLNQGRNDKGQFQEAPMACLVFDEALSLADTLVLDPDYLEFLQDLTRNRHNRVQQVANLILLNIREEAGRHPDLLAPQARLDQIASRQVAQQYLQEPAEGRKQIKLQIELPDENPFFGVDYSRLDALQEQENSRGKNLPTVENLYKSDFLYENHREKNFPTVNPVENFARGKILPTVVDGSSGGINNNINNINIINKNNKLNNKTTTTTTPTPPPASWPDEKPGSFQAEATDVPGVDTSALIWPPSLSQPEREVCVVVLRALPPQWWQDALDELEGRIRWGKVQGDPLRNKIRWLKAVCDQTNRAGMFTPAMGLEVQTERANRAAAKAKAEKKTTEATSTPRDDKAGHTDWRDIAIERQMVKLRE